MRVRIAYSSLVRAEIHSGKLLVVDGQSTHSIQIVWEGNYGGRFVGNRCYGCVLSLVLGRRYDVCMYCEVASIIVNRTRTENGANDQ